MLANAFPPPFVPEIFVALALGATSIDFLRPLDALVDAPLHVDVCVNNKFLCTSLRQIGHRSNLEPPESPASDSRARFLTLPAGVRSSTAFSLSLRPPLPSPSSSSSFFFLCARVKNASSVVVFAFMSSSSSMQSPLRLLRRLLRRLRRR